MIDLGDRTEDSTVQFAFFTRTGDGTPASIEALVGTAPASVGVYKANNTTESAAGVVFTPDFDGRTGVNHVSIDTSADAFYATANDYYVVVTDGEVAGGDVTGTIVATFSIQNRFGGVASADLDPLIEAIDLGNRSEDSTIRFHFRTLDTLTAAVGTAPPTVSVYKAADTTQSVAGVTVTTDFDGVTGLNQVTIDTSADAFYATANDYSIVITDGSVGVANVNGTTVATFSIQNRFGAAGGSAVENLVEALDLGDRTEDSTINFTFRTVGALEAVAGTGAPTIEVYKGTSNTQTAAGITVVTDFDGVTGLNHVSIDTSADVFYATANDYHVVITDGEVATNNVSGATVATFSIQNRFSAGGGGGATAAQVWGYATRTLTQTAAQVASVLSGTTITVQRGDTFSVSLTGLGDINDRTHLWFTVKDRQSDLPDSEAVIQVLEETGTAADGLLRIQGKAPISAANGSITVDDATAGDITIAIAAAETANLTASTRLKYDVQVLRNTGNVNTLTEANAAVTGDVTRVIT